MTEQIKNRIAEIKQGKVPDGYKKTEVGIIPRKWSVLPLGKRVNIFRGASPRPKGDPQYYGGPVPRLLIEDVTRDGKYAYPKIDSLTEEGAKKSRLLPKGSIVMSCSGTKVGIVGYLGIDACIHDGFFGFNEFIELNNDFVYYLFIYATQKLQVSATTGGVFNNLTTDIMRNLILPFPALNEQEKIAKVLMKWDETIALQKKLIEKLEVQKKALMQRLLTPKEDWVLTSLGKVLKSGSKDGVTDTSKYKKITIKLDFKGLEFTEIKREMADTRPFYIRKKGEIIVGKQNYFNGSVAIVSDEFDGCICSNAIMSFNVVNADTSFVFHYISQPDLLRKYENLANGTGQKELSEKDFLSFEMRLPSIEHQQYISNIIGITNSHLNIQIQKLEKLKLQQKSLMQLLLIGIVRV